MKRPFSAYDGDDPYIFVSYSHEDAAMVYPEISRLRDSGFNIWYDEGIAPGLTWRDEVALALTQCKVFLFFLTPQSASSPNCLKEVNFCLSRERKVLAVHLQETDLPIGLEFSLSDRQAIIRNDHTDDVFQQKLTDGLTALLPGSTIPATPEPPASSSESTARQSIAILPLVNRSNDPDNEYLCDGIAEELICGLAPVAGLKVASQLSSFALKNQNMDARQMGERLGVEHILSGSVQKSGSRVRISVLLSQANDGSNLWSNRYDRELDDIFLLQEDVAKHVVDALKIELGADRPEQLLDAGTEDPQAYELFLVGLSAARSGTSTSLQEAVLSLGRAVELDPGFGRAHWWLYFCYWRLIGVGLPRPEMEAKAEQALDRARATDFSPPVPWVKARRDLFPATRPDQRALAMEACEKIRTPDADWHLFEYIQLGECLITAGLNHGACDFYERYLDRVDHDLSATWIVHRYRYLLQQVGRFDKAIELCSEIIAQYPTRTVERAGLYSRTGQYQKAQQDLQAAESSWGSEMIYNFYYLYWRGELNESNLDWLSDHEPQYRSLGCFLLGDIDGGIDHLEEDIRRGVDPSVFRSNVGAMLPQSILRTVEANPRFKAILRQFGVDDVWRDDLMSMTNRLSAYTGINVRPDDDY